MSMRRTLPNRREFMNGLIGAAGALSAAGASAKSRGEVPSQQASEGRLQKPLLYFNDDANVLVYSASPLQPEGLANYVGMLGRSGIDILAWDVSINGVCLYGGSKAGPGVNEGREPIDLESSIAAENIRHLTQAGANPPALVAQECHRYGVRMIAAFRMGETIITKSRMTGGGGVYYNPKVIEMGDKVVKTLPIKDRSYSGWANPKVLSMLDWAHPEVRELVLAPIREVVEKFDVDGIELTAHGCIFFDADQAVHEAPIMTGFVREVRQVLDQAAQRKGKDHLLLGARVFDEPGVNLRYGLDVGEWIKHDLVDIVMPTQGHGIYFDAPIEEFVNLCKGHQCLVLPTISPGMPIFTYSQFSDFNHLAYTLPQVRAVVESWYRRGASGISTYNFQHRASDSVPWDEAVGWLKQLSDPAFVRTGERTWPLFGISLSFRSDEVGIRKTIAVPRYAVVPLSDHVQPPKLRFQALQLAPHDVLEIDVDGVRVANIHTEFTISRKHQGWITGQFTHSREGDLSDLYPAFTVEAPLANLRPSSEIGVRLLKRHFLSEIQITEVSIETLGRAEG